MELVPGKLYRYACKQDCVLVTDGKPCGCLFLGSPFVFIESDTWRAPEHFMRHIKIATRGGLGWVWVIVNGVERISV